ncbi:hypothetical protein K450DRAFT_221637 [Umbelopsis ramanniana AG]|uniref:Uncharacterized protein n=1 Tax=Umbelopsis ramanniana AG TaxID=1314678 RepID=A0AAD5EGY8_UMBRA|nr:uncharacterized protein K450DRAFT_221637 [Umbelopsis ramanniana AG]KAI8583538.1 hypothetical protein K450DRAFT_221637 [Umbelopsis ramanniana AG]
MVFRYCMTIIPFWLSPFFFFCYYNFLYLYFWCQLEWYKKTLILSIPSCVLYSAPSEFLYMIPSLCPGGAIVNTHTSGSQDAPKNGSNAGFVKCAICGSKRHQTRVSCVLSQDLHLAACTNFFVIRKELSGITSPLRRLLFISNAH